MDEWIDMHIGPRAMKYFIERRLTPVAESVGLKPTYGPFLMTVRENEGLSLKTLSEMMIVDKALTTRVTKRLIEGGYLEDRSVNTREYSLYLTSKGRKATDKISDAIKDAWKELFRDLTDEEVECLKGIHCKIDRRLRDDAEALR